MILYEQFFKILQNLINKNKIKAYKFINYNSRFKNDINYLIIINELVHIQNLEIKSYQRKNNKKFN